MKQRIDSAQLRELTPEQQEKLREKWIPQIGDCITQPGVSDKTIFMAPDG